MAYQQTDKTRRHKEETRLRILYTAREMITEGGFIAVHMSSVAHGAGLATGSLYRYFPCKADLLADVFRLVTQREVKVMAAVAASGGLATIRLAAAIETFARRAMRAPRLAYSLIFEPVDPLVETERLVFRSSYAKIIACLIEEGIASGEFPSQNAAVVANCVVGALAEALVGPLAASQTQNSEETAQTIVTFCLSAVKHSPTSEVTS
jgi:AcrR family transcriptional regulator